MNTLLNIQKKNIQSTTQNNTCAGVLVKTLIDLGIDSIFGYPGASVLSIYNELSKTDKITHYLVRHEQAALHAAEGYSRTSGKTGVVLVTSGPGFTNTITGIANAYSDLTPLVIFAGDVPTTTKNEKTFQKVNIKSMVESCTKKVFMLSETCDIQEIVKEAFDIANTDPKGPVVLSLPRNLLESIHFPAKNKKSVSKTISINYSQQIKKIQKIIKNSKKPLILVGGGCINASDEIKKLVTEMQCPVVSTLMGIGIYPSENKDYIGMIGINGSYIANSALSESDLILAFGVAFSDRSTCKNINFVAKSKIISVNIDKISEKFQLEIKADVKEFLKSLLHENIQVPDFSDWKYEIEKFRMEDINLENYSNRLHSSFVLKTLSEYTKNLEPIVVTDVGQHQLLTAQFFNFNKPRKFITSGGLGTMGFGLPASIGAHIANPNNLVINITGDGSFQMNLQELATCREHNIPIKIIIMNNGYLGMVREIQEKIYNNRFQVKMTNPDFTKIAESYDLFAIRVTKQEELLPAIKEAINYNGTVIVDIMIDSFENI